MRHLLLAAGIATLVAWWLPWYEGGWHGLVSEIPTGPFGLPLEWEDRLGDVTLTLGVVAVLTAVFPSRGLASAAAVVLALGAAFLGAWLVDPLPGAGVRWPAYMAAIAPAIGAIAAALLTRRGAAATGRPWRARARRGSPPPHSPTPPR